MMRTGPPTSTRMSRSSSSPARPLAGNGREILDDLRVRKLETPSWRPRVLDEGIDVPDANLGVASSSASRNPPPDDPADGPDPAPQARGHRPAPFVIMFAKDTLEDPANRIERAGFLDEIERISEASGVFDGGNFEQLAAFLARPAPRSCRYRNTSNATSMRSPPPASPGRSRSTMRWFGRSRTVSDPSSPTCWSRSRVMIRTSGPRPSIRALDARLPRPSHVPEYLPLELAELPHVSKPASSPSGSRPASKRSRSRASASGGASAAPDAAKLRRSWSSAGRCSTRPSPAAAPERRTGPPADRRRDRVLGSHCQSPTRRSLLQDTRAMRVPPLGTG